MTGSGLLEATTTRSRYRAYGVELACEFPLPWGSVGTGAGVARWAVTAAARPRPLVEALWSGASGDPVHSTVLSDGRALVIERGRVGDHLIRFGEHPFHLTPDLRQLTCAPPRGPDPAWLRVLFDWVAYAICALRGSHCLHASAVRTEAGVVALAAPSGMGKTTLAAALLGPATTFFCDDVLVLERGAGGVLGHPGPPFANVAGADRLTAARLGARSGPLGGDLWVSVRRPAAEPAPVAAVVLLERGEDGPATPELDTAGFPALRRLVVGFPGTVAREAERLSLLSALASQASVLRLRASRSTPAEDLARSIRARLGAPEAR